VSRRVVDLEKFNEGGRGLWRAFCKDYEGTRFIVQDSSLATEATMRLTICRAILEDGFASQERWEPGQGIHIDRATAKYLRQRLDRFLKTGSPRPARMKT